MNPSFEAALTARLLWIDVICLGGIEGVEEAVTAAVQAACEAVNDLAACEVFGRSHYGPNVPLLLQDVPQLAMHYLTTYESYIELSEQELLDMDYHEARERHMRDLADTYDSIESELVAGWKADCRDNDLL
jgi:hypothetical protein